MPDLLETRSYQPSWLFRFLDWISQLPGPRWLNFQLLPLILFVLTHGIVFLVDPSQAWRVQGEFANLIFWLSFGLLGFDYLESRSQQALREFRSSIDVSDEEFSGLKKRFGTVPRVWGWLVLPALAFSIQFARLRPPMAAPPEFAALFNALGILLATITFTGVFHLIVTVIYQLRMINQLYARVSTINIFNLQDLYGLSALSARIGVLFILAGTFSYIANVVLPGGEPQIEIAVFFISMNTAMAVAAFLLPLLGIHRKLADVKQRVARQNNHVINSTLDKLHERSQRAELAEMPLIESQVGALMKYRREIEKISTWPWQPQTLRGFITAISLPIVIWLIQQYLDRIIGG